MGVKTDEELVIKSSNKTDITTAIRMAVKVAKFIYPSAKTVVFRRDGMDIEISELDSEKSLYEKFIEMKRSKVSEQ